ncbi:hypothetical protein M758_UG200900 [Ceratodon purpureus]|nr:hypothetical protein M758_UG200900 [Ceratodon purpureus]
MIEVAEIKKKMVHKMEVRAESEGFYRKTADERKQYLYEMNAEFIELGRRKRAKERARDNWIEEQISNAKKMKEAMTTGEAIGEGTSTNIRQSVWGGGSTIIPEVSTDGTIPPHTPNPGRNVFRSRCLCTRMERRTTGAVGT